jgi:hypothetical protein
MKMSFGYDDHEQGSGYFTFWHQTSFPSSHPTNQLLQLSDGDPKRMSRVAVSVLGSDKHPLFKILIGSSG